VENTHLALRHLFGTRIFKNSINRIGRAQKGVKLCECYLHGGAVGRAARMLTSNQEHTRLTRDFLYRALKDCYSVSSALDWKSTLSGWHIFSWFNFELYYLYRWLG